ncbi:hypothetical protein [Streptomyces sp. 900105755]
MGTLGTAGGVYVTLIDAAPEAAVGPAYPTPEVAVVSSDADSRMPSSATSPLARSATSVVMS